MCLPQVCPRSLSFMRTINQRMQPETPHHKTILAQAYEFTDGEMFFIHEDNVKTEDMFESTLEDWKLPPSIEDEEDRLSDRPLGIILEEARGTPGKATLFTHIW
jgi:hypothetical protein